MTAVIPRLEFLKKKEVKRGAGEFIDVYDAAWGDGGKIHNSGDENVDLDTFETRLVAACVPVQHCPGILPVPRRSSVEVVVCFAKLLLNAFCTTVIGGEAKDIKILNESGQ